MKFLDIKTEASKEAVLNMLCDNERTNTGVIFEPRLGKPLMHVKSNGNKLGIRCEFLDRGKKDNGFIIGTRFWGWITEKNGYTRVNGFITTELIFHLVLLSLFTVFIVQCIHTKSFSPVPLILLIFDLYMFKDEFKKQGIIKRYILRAVRKVESDINYQ
jgi:hypothetical protein